MDAAFVVLFYLLSLFLDKKIVLGQPAKQSCRKEKLK